ncbi:DNA polymerase theta [Hyalella azteca]|uniref:DNA polymerase theta n=1 Tax=Hyalella azteca TaxID=294128 RepID=A0A8B7MYU9_HYAAZ|nr:DNA polymerase theta [Hyalella azteca]
MNSSIQLGSHAKDSDLRPGLSHYNLPEAIYQKYEENGIKNLFEWQHQCLQLPDVLQGRNLVYSAPTSAGKTLVAELLLLKRVLETKKKAIFIVPFVSMAKEKTNYLQRVLSGGGVVVEGFMGGQVPAGGLTKVDVAVCTIEKANNLCNRMMQEGTLGDISVVVVDELHLVSDGQRGYLLELLLTKLRFSSLKAERLQLSGHEKTNTLLSTHGDALEGTPLLVSQQGHRENRHHSLFFSQENGGTDTASTNNHLLNSKFRRLQIIGMSATLPNVSLLAEWLDAALYVTDHRPVPLTHLLLNEGSLFTTDMKLIQKLPYEKSAKDPDGVLGLCVQTLLEGFSVLVFCASRARTESLAVAIARHVYTLGSSASVAPCHEAIRKTLDAASLTRVLQVLHDSPAGLDKTLACSLQYGAAFHHAGLTTEERDIIEASFRAGIVRVLVATSTLSSGVNLPARRVIIRSPFSAAGRPLDPLAYHQMAGRAGRKGVDTQGECVLVCSGRQELTVGRELVTAPLPHVTSCLTAHSLTSALKRALLEVVVSGAATSLPDLLDYCRCTLLAACIAERRRDDGAGDDDGVGGLEGNTVQSCIKYLLDNEFISRSGEELSSSPLGRAVLRSGLSPDEGLLVFAELHAARRCLVLDTDFHLVMLVTPIYISCEPDWLALLGVWEALPAAIRRVASLLGVRESFIVQAVKGTISIKSEQQATQLRLQKRFYTALALHDLLQEVPLPDVASKFNINKGLLQSLQQSAATFAGMVKVFCSCLGWRSLWLLVQEFEGCLQFGVRRELCDLAQLPHVSSSTARRLFSAGITSLHQLATTSHRQLVALLEKSAPFASRAHGDQSAALKKNKQKREEGGPEGGGLVWVEGVGLTSIAQEAHLILNDARTHLMKEIGAPEIKWDENNSNLETSSESSIKSTSGDRASTEVKNLGTQNSSPHEKALEPPCSNTTEQSRCASSNSPVVNAEERQSNAKPKACASNEHAPTATSNSNLAEMNENVDEEVNIENNSTEGTNIIGSAGSSAAKCTKDIPLNGEHLVSGNGINSSKINSVKRVFKIDKIPVQRPKPSCIPSKRATTEEYVSGALPEVPSNEAPACGSRVQMDVANVRGEEPGSFVSSRAQDTPHRTIPATSLKTPRKDSMEEDMFADEINSSVTSSLNGSVDAVPPAISTNSDLFSEDEDVFNLPSTGQICGVSQDPPLCRNFEQMNENSPKLPAKPGPVEFVARPVTDVDLVNNEKRSRPVNGSDPERVSGSVLRGSSGLVTDNEFNANNCQDKLITRNLAEVSKKSTLASHQSELSKNSSEKISQDANRPLELEESLLALSLSPWTNETPLVNSIPAVSDEMDCNHDELYENNLPPCDQSLQFNLSHEISQRLRSVPGSNMGQKKAAVGTAFSSKKDKVECKAVCDLNEKDPIADDLKRTRVNFEDEFDDSLGISGSRICSQAITDEFFHPKPLQDDPCDEKSSKRPNVNSLLKSRRIYEPQLDVLPIESSWSELKDDRVLGSLSDLSIYDAIDDRNYKSPVISAKSEQQNVENHSREQAVVNKCVVGNTEQFFVNTQQMAEPHAGNGKYSFSEIDMSDPNDMSALLTPDGKLPQQLDTFIPPDPVTLRQVSTLTCAIKFPQAPEIVISSTSTDIQCPNSSSILEKTLRKPDEAFRPPAAVTRPPLLPKSQVNHTENTDKKKLSSRDESTPLKSCFRYDKNSTPIHFINSKQSKNSETVKRGKENYIGITSDSNNTSANVQRSKSKDLNKAFDLSSSSENDFSRLVSMEEELLDNISGIEPLALSKACPDRDLSKNNTSLKTASPCALTLVLSADQSFSTELDDNDVALDKAQELIFDASPEKEYVNHNVASADEKISSTNVHLADLNKKAAEDSKVTVQLEKKESYLHKNKSNLNYIVSEKNTRSLSSDRVNGCTVRIIDVFKSSNLLKAFLDKLDQQENFSLVLLRNENSSRHQEAVIEEEASQQDMEEMIPEDECVDTGLLGIVVAWQASTAYHLSLASASGEKVSLEERMSAIRRIIVADPDHSTRSSGRSHGSAVHGSAVVWESCSAVASLWRATGIFFTRPIKDVVTAAWLLGSSVFSITALAEEHVPEASWLCRDDEVQARHDGQVSAAGRRAALTLLVMQALELRLQQRHLHHHWLLVEMPAAVVLAKLQLNGMGLCPERYQETVTSITKLLGELESEAHRACGRSFKLSSYTELASVLYKTLRLPPPSDWRQRLSKESLKALKRHHPLPGIVLQWRKLNAALIKMLVPLEKRAEHNTTCGMRRVYPRCYRLTATGRVNMAEPSLQCVPRDVTITTEPRAAGDANKFSTPLMQLLLTGKKNRPSSKQTRVSCRRVIAASAGRVLLAADYCQLELRVLAHCADDARLKRLLAEDDERDVFLRIASDVFGAQQSVVAQQRDLAGMGSKSLAMQLNVSVEEAERKRQEFLEAFPGVKAFMANAVAKARQNGFVATVMGRRRHLENIASQISTLRSQSERQAVNSLIQGSAADIVKSAMVSVDAALTRRYPHQQSVLADVRSCVAGANIHEHFNRQDNLRPQLKVHFVLQLHDELMYEVAEEELLAVAAILKHHMEKTTRLDVPLPVKLKAGPTWGDMTDLIL